MMSNIAFILFQAGETKALLPTIEQLVHNSSHRIRIIPVGQPARHNVPKTLRAFVKTPSFIQQGLGQNDTCEHVFLKKQLQEVMTYCKDYEIIIIGFSSKIAEQIAHTLPATKQRIIYFDDMNYIPSKVDAFLAHADTFIMTTLDAKNKTKKHISENNITRKPTVFAARHGDFDTWKHQSIQHIKNSKNIRKALHVNQVDKVILWAGSYGDYSSNDQEARAFKTFLKAYAPYLHDYQLRITLHPGLKSHALKQVNLITKTYYLDALSTSGVSKKAAKHMITTLDTIAVTCIAHAVISFSSRTGAQAHFIGVQAKNVFLKNGPVLNGIESVKTPKRWQTLLKQWSSKKPRIFKTNKKLSIPSKTTTQILNSILV
jgi:hypothetical protein